MMRNLAVNWDAQINLTEIRLKRMLQKSVPEFLRVGFKSSFEVLKSEFEVSFELRMSPI